MIPGLKVIAPGPHTTIQDFGRTGYRYIGVPVSGALDPIALALANALVGNAESAPALEMLMQGPTLEVMAASVRISLVGGTKTMDIEGANSRRVPSGQSVRLVRGERLSVGPLEQSACAYLAIEGGLDVPLCLGSASTYTRARLGGFRGRAVAPGDVLPIRQEDVAARSERMLATVSDFRGDQPIRVVLGPQLDYFTEDAVRTLLSATYTVSARADRMGYRLDGPTLTHAKGCNIVSDGIAVGSIQVPGSGQPIVLLADAQTTGGYPKIATVTSADVPLVGRRRPGEPIRFAAVTQEQAESIRREQAQNLRQWLSDVRPVDRVNLTALHAANLIGGVTDALGD
jgi:allophanate hydrolase